MPNNVRNDITIKAPKAKLAEIAAHMKGDDGPFDFNKLIPMPEELQSITTGHCHINGTSYLRWRENVDGGRVGIEPKEAAELVQKHGAADWYDWARRNWGTKWNAYAVDEKLTSRSLRYRFDTAWTSPERVLQALADKFLVSIQVNVSGEVECPYSYTVAPTVDA